MTPISQWLFQGISLTGFHGYSQMSHWEQRVLGPPIGNHYGSTSQSSNMVKWIVPLERKVKNIPVFPKLNWSRNLLFPIASGRTSFTKNATLSHTDSKIVIDILLFCSELAIKVTIKNRTVQPSLYVHFQWFKESNRKYLGEKNSVCTKPYRRFLLVHIA